MFWLEKNLEFTRIWAIKKVIITKAYMLFPKENPVSHPVSSLLLAIIPHQNRKSYIS